MCCAVRTNAKPSIAFSLPFQRIQEEEITEERKRESPDVSAVSSHRSGRRLELFFSGRAEVRAQSGMERGDRIASSLQILAQSSFSQPSDSQGRLGGRGSGEEAIGLSEADLRHSSRASSLRKLNNCAPPALFIETA